MAWRRVREASVLSREGTHQGAGEPVEISVRRGARRSPTGALSFGPGLAVLRSPRFDHVLKLLPAYGLDAAREAHLESAPRQADLSASAVYPLPAQRSMLQHPSAGLAPAEA